MFEDGTIFNELFIERLNYIIYVILLLIGLHGMIAKNNLIKKLIGMSIFQTAIILFYVSVGVKEGATIPIYLPEHDPHGSHVTSFDENSSSEESHGPVALEPDLVKGYANPLPHHDYCIVGCDGPGPCPVPENLSGIRDYRGR